MSTRNPRRWMTWAWRTAGILLLPVLTLAYWQAVPPYPALTIEMGPGEEIHALAPDFPLLATQTRRQGNLLWRGGPVRVWDLASGALLLTVDDPEHDLSQADFSPDGRWLLTADDHGRVLNLWDIQAGKLHGVGAILQGAGEELRWKFSPDGRLLLVEEQIKDDTGMKSAKQIRVVEIETCRPLSGEIAGSLDWTVFSADGRRLALLPKNFHWEQPFFAPRSLEVWRFDADTISRTATHAIPSPAVAVTPDFTRFATLSQNQAEGISVDVELRDMETGGVVARYHQPRNRGAYSWCRFAPEGRLLIVGWVEARVASDGKDGSTVVTEYLRVGDEFRSLGLIEGHGDFSSDKKRYIVYGGEKAAVWDTEANTVLTQIAPPPPHNLGVSAQDFRHVHFLVWTRDGSAVTATNLSRMHGLSSLGHAWNGRWQQALEGDGRWTLEVRRAETGERLAFPSGLARLEVSRDGRRIVSGHADGTVKVWDGWPRTPWVAIVAGSSVTWLAILIAVAIIRRLVRRAKSGRGHA